MASGSGAPPPPSLRATHAPMGDPCALLERAAFHAILEALPVQDLAACLCVSQQWRDAALDERLWARHVQELWKDKAYVPAHIRALSSKRRAYALSLEDATRTAITEEELTSFTWLFHFKEDAGSWWSTLASGNAPLRRYFHADHTMTRSRNDPMGQFGEQHYAWSLRQTKGGTFVQVNRYPCLELKRLPDWGWQMDNIWVTMRADMAAGPNPGKGKEPTHEEQPGRARVLGHVQALLAMDVDDDEHDAGWDAVVETLAQVFTAHATAAAQAPPADDGEDKAGDGVEGAVVGADGGGAPASAIDG